MSSMVALKHRIKSVRSTRQITKAMELISASKMHRASEAARVSRQYTAAAEVILGHLYATTNVARHELYVTRPVTCRLYIVITSNRGLSGSYNKNVLQEFAKQLQASQAIGIACKALLVGRQAGRFAGRLRGLDVIGVYDALPDRPTTADISPLLSTAFMLFTQKDREAPQVDEVVLLYTRYISSLVHKVTSSVLLPAGVVGSPEARSLVEVLFEPSPAVVLGVTTRKLIEAEVLQAYLESQASEQSARMLAMKTASDNAKDLIDDLVLATNTLRQATITRELSEITGGAEALA